MRAQKLYSWLLRFYPATFRERHQHAIQQQFNDEYREAHTRRERAVLWLRAIADLAFSAPPEVARELAQDLKYTLRVYQSHALSAVLAIGALALAIGASTGVFTVLNALLLRALPFAAPEQLVELRSSPVNALSGRSAFHAWSRRSAYLDGAAALSSSQMNLAARRTAVRVTVTETSANFLSLLGMSPVVGRIFQSDEETGGRTGVAVISYGLWQQLFGADPGVSGESIALNGSPFTIIGVAPQRFDFPGRTAVWTPTAFAYERVPKRGAFSYETIGRLKPDLSFSHAQTLFQAEVQQLAPELLRGDEFSRARLVSLREKLSGPVGDASLVLAGMIFLLLLIACANVAHLLLSRLAARRQEFAVRAALGASSTRIVQQLITEATALTLAAAVLGLVLAHWVSRLAASVAPPELEAQEYTLRDWRVLAFVIAIAVLTGLIFGLLPSLFFREQSGPLTRTREPLRDRRTAGIRFFLLAVQACLTLALLASSLMLGRAFLSMLHADLGFRPSNTITMTVSLQGTRRRTAQAEWQYYTEALERLRATPGVHAAGAVSYVPLADHLYRGSAIKLDSGQSVKLAVMNAATPGYFGAMGARFIAGQDFAVSARSDAEVIVNDAFAQAMGLGAEILARRVIAPWGETSYRIAGVVETSRLAGPASAGPPMVYWPVAEEPPPNLTFVARVGGDAEKHLARCRDAVRAVDPEAPLYDVLTLEQRLAKVLARPRFFVTATLALTAIALILALVGIFGSAAHAVAQRTQEFGIRMALGASATRLRALLIRQTVVPTGLGAALGIALALGQGHSLGRLLTDVKGLEFGMCSAAALVLLLAAAAASWVATARLLAIDPAAAVRADTTR